MNLKTYKRVSVEGRIILNDAILRVITSKSHTKINRKVLPKFFVDQHKCYVLYEGEILGDTIQIKLMVLGSRAA